ncbi:AraC family transcriptional regulator [Bacillus sp. 7586-K]|uniref:YesN/AraC family two-component response regulator n=1 Tax=Metabacillus niabensis TaxID=324854 RepID=A0ABT9Z1W5_9BACI|nr:helix-turn-helix domain-containing protein [Metabacillus niabensis]MDQ0226238.1 YesN/AraC family two-component response regulator [Metabacillus niabensis]PAD69067.1 AraC family transcriptional regulator [Bacillus sp. 7586-K]
MDILKADIHQPLEYISGGLFHSDEPWIHSKRVINSYELIIGIEQTLFIQQDETQYKVNPGDVLLLLPNHLHQGYKISPGNLSFYWFHFHCSGSSELISKNDLVRDITLAWNQPISQRNNTNVYVPVFSTPNSIERIQIQCQQLLHIAKSAYYTNQAVHFQLTSLLIELTEQMSSLMKTQQHKTEADIKLEKMKEWIRINSSKTITVTMLAEKFNYNKDYLSRFFKRKTGINIVEYINLMKISKAKELLSSTSLPIKVITNHVGIEDEKYFMRLFKKYENMTPTEFRNAYYRTHMNNK